MTLFDWITLSATLLFIIVYGVYKNRNDKNIDGYLLGNQSLPWYHVGLSVMATQASAITFLSAPGQAYTDGMRFIQFYFGLPLAMIVLCITFIPIFHRLKVYTAYEYLESRFDSRVRVFTALLFLVQRGLSTGISIYAPSIILSTIFGWDIFYTNIIMGGLVLTYTVIGGTKAISHTHLQQMLIVTAAMIFAGVLIVKSLPESIGFTDALKLAGESGRMNVINFEFDYKDRYNVWSGLIAGFFLQLSYFGTDQSQVSRYLTGQSVTQSRLGLVMNGLLKIPMQFSILILGILVFVFYQYNASPVFFNKVETDKLLNSQYATEYKALESQHNELTSKRKEEIIKLQNSIKVTDNQSINSNNSTIREIDNQLKDVKKGVVALIKKNDSNADSNDVNFIFLRFVLDHIPHGLIGLLIAVIFSASMGSVASAYNSLASCTVIDIYRKTTKKTLTESLELNASKIFTVLWGIFCIVVAQFAHNLGSSMIELVNILGSWFYGVILGIFIVAFYFKKIGSAATFYSAVISQILVILIWYFDLVAYLWLNPIGCVLVVGLAAMITPLTPKGESAIVE
jgi:solute carrier family 5 (sodium-dependent multivitamin transporter), member 6